MHLHCLAVKIECFLGDYFSPVMEILLGNIDGQVAEISQPVFLLVFCNPLESLFVSPCRTDTVNLAVVAVIVTTLSQRDFLGDGMFRLCFRGF